MRVPSCFESKNPILLNEVGKKRDSLLRVWLGVQLAVV